MEFHFLVFVIENIGNIIGCFEKETKITEFYYVIFLKIKLMKNFIKGQMKSIFQNTTEKIR